MRPTLAALIASALLATPVLAIGQQNEPMHAPDWRAPQRITPIYISPRANAPFSATAATLWVRTLADGSTVNLQNEREVARDAEGRIFQERATFVPSPNPKRAGSQVYATQYDDPTEHKSYRCVPPGKVCNLVGYDAPADTPMTPAGLQPDKTSFIAREDLGMEVLDGFEVQHSRETTTLYSGAAGNTRTILRVCEYWYSPALGINLKVKRHDPRDGDQTLWLEKISQSEPDAQTFKVPAEYRIVDHLHPLTQEQVQGTGTRD